ncbi:entry exclusion lipoprotein TrbK [Nitrosomonas supralitoralis]|uniref:Entry exclusion lipoprotein TrbK n=1 Tax=Nitrosomonas supralitoralis TaxID=2116706 RepID=A0A2P7NV03_9PROT|nr:entry exclusion lipoprotein TrbK [Nitrosomonas supralitoralis]PSJ17300.1 entry exclusion lipoprotein TrbK [Nitrosomonas supralitoralis]
MNFRKYSIACMVGLCFSLVGCGGAPEASLVNCAGKGLESSLADLKDNEVARQAFLDQCDALKK